MLVPQDLGERVGLAKDQVQVNEKYGGGFPANVEGLHQLHCLVSDGSDEMKSGRRGLTCLEPPPPRPVLQRGVLSREGRRCIQEQRPYCEEARL